jgi:hypothetical protein
MKTFYLKFAEKRRVHVFFDPYISNTKEILKDSQENMSSRLISRDITFYYGNLLLKQKCSNDMDNGSQAVEF